MQQTGPTWPTWEAAWQRALYGPAGFYRRPEGPAGHFRTASHAAPQALAEALIRLTGAQGCPAIVDVGAGRGELLTAVHERSSGLRLHGVDVVARPGGLPAEIAWSVGLGALPAGTLTGALVVAWELLDTVPCPVLEIDEDGVPRVVHVDPRSGRERLGAAIGAHDRAWCDRWWPASGDAGDAGERIEAGRPREELWTGLVRRAAADGGAVLLAVDYGHVRADRPALGSLAGYRAGRLVPAVPDGSCDVTAHVAMDAVASAGQAAGARTLAHTTQRDALRLLGLTGRGAREAELLDPNGLGGFGWLLQTV